MHTSKPRYVTHREKRKEPFKIDLDADSRVRCRRRVEKYPKLADRLAQMDEARKARANGSERADTAE